MKYLSIAFALLFASSNSFAQIINIGCQTEGDAFVGVDRSDWNSGDDSASSEGYFNDFTLPDNTFGDCKKIEEINIYYTIFSENLTLPSDCLFLFYQYNFFVGCGDTGPASCSHSGLVGGETHFSASDVDVPVSILCTHPNIAGQDIFGMSLEVDIIPVISAGSCADFNSQITDGGATVSYEVCVEVVIGDLDTPGIDASAVNNNICPGQDIELEENGPDADMWNWSGPAGYSSTDQNPVITAASSAEIGTYMLTITDANGCTNTAEVVLTENPQPDINVDVVDNMICPGEDIALSENAGDATMWSWTGPDGFVATSDSPTITAATSANIGTYFVTITDGAGCTNEANIEVMENPPPAASASAVNTMVCPGQVIELQESGGAADTWNWSGPDSYSNTNQNPTITGITSANIGIYVVTVTDINGCTNTSEVEIFAVPPPTAIASGVNVCLGDNIDLTETGGDAVDWNWEGPNGFGSTDQNPTVSPTTAASFGMYSVTVTDASNCTNVASVTIDPLPAPSAVADAVSSNVCLGQELELLETGGDGDQWSWEGPDGFASTDQNPDLNLLDLNQYGLYTVTVTDALGCTNTAEITITQGTPPNVMAEAANIMVCEGQEIALDETGGDGFQWEWDGPGGFSSTLQNPTIPNSTSSDLGLFVVTVTDTDGCTDSSEITISGLPTPEACILGGGILCIEDCGSSNLVFDIDLFGSSNPHDLEVSFPGTTLSNFLLEDVNNGDLIEICVDDISDIAFSGSELILPSSDLTDQVTFQIQLVDVIDQTNTTCPGTFDANCFIDVTYLAYATPDILSTGTPISDGDQFVCESNFSPEIDVTLDGVWTIDFLPVTLPIDLSTYSPGSYTLAFEPDAGQCAEGSMVDIEVVSCSCSIDDAGLNGLTCNNGGTDSDDTDDFISFDINPTATNGSTYILSVSAGTVTPMMGSYGTVQNIQLQAGSAGSGDIILTMTDVDDPSCSLDVTINDPGSCSGTCNIIGAGLVDLTCDNNLTATISTDDFLILSLNPEVDNPGSGYTLTPLVGSVNPTTALYGEVTDFEFNPGSAGGGNFMVVLTDIDDPTCEFVFNINDPGSCSTSCLIQNTALSNIQCDDNNTPTFEGDDFLTFDLNVLADNGGVGYTIEASPGTLTPATGTYGTATSFEMQAGSAGGGNSNILIIDDTDPDCTLQLILIDQGACSDDCQILDAGLMNVMCNDNATPLDDTDDFISFDIEPTSVNTSTTYTISASSGTLSSAVGAFGMFNSFSLQPGSAGGGDISITLTDDDNSSCELEFVISDPGACSANCNIVDLGLFTVDCVAASPGQIVLSINPDVSNSTSIGYTITTNIGTLSMTQGDYGSFTDFTIDGIGPTDVEIEIEVVDLDDPLCSYSTEVPLPDCDCLDPVGIVNTTIQEEICGDEIIDLSVTLSGSGTDVTWEVINGDGTFDAIDIINPTYTPGPLDIQNGMVTFLCTTNDPDGPDPTCMAAMIEFEILINTPTEPDFTVVLEYCEDANIPDLPLISDEGIAGSWTPALDNTATTVYTFLPDANQCAEETMITIEILDAISPDFDLPMDLCSMDDSFDLPLMSTNGIEGSWDQISVDPSTTSTYTFTPDDLGCSEILQYSPTINENETSVVTLEFCENESIDTFGFEFNAGFSELLLTVDNAASNGCDSVYMIQSIVLDTSELIIQEILCLDDTIVVNGVVYDFNNDFGTELMTNQLGCDSTVIIDLTFEQSFGYEIIPPCPGEEDGILVLQQANGTEFPINVLDLMTGELMTINGLPAEIPVAGLIDLEITDANGCFFNLMDQTPISSDFTFQIESQDLGDNAFELSINSNISIFDNIQWQTMGAGDCDSCPTNSINIQSDQLVYVDVTYGLNCTFRDSIFLTAIEESQVFVPNIINLNDSQNGQLQIFSNNPMDRILRMSIYDKWGNRVFHEENGLITETRFIWQVNQSSNLTDGVYVIMLEIEPFGYAQRLIIDDITLFR